MLTRSCVSMRTQLCMRVKVDIEVSHTDVTLFSLFNVRLLLRNVEEC